MQTLIKVIVESEEKLNQIISYNILQLSLIKISLEGYDKFELQSLANSVGFLYKQFSFLSKHIRSDQKKIDFFDLYSHFLIKCQPLFSKHSIFESIFITYISTSHSIFTDLSMQSPLLPKLLSSLQNNIKIYKNCGLISTKKIMMMGSDSVKIWNKVLKNYGSADPTFAKMLSHL